MAATVISSELEATTQRDGSLSAVHIFEMSDGSQQVKIVRLPAKTNLETYKTSIETARNAKLIEKETQRTEQGVLISERDKLMAYLKTADLPRLAGMDASKVDDVLEGLL